MKRWLFVILGILLTVILAIVLIGLLLPEQHIASRTLQTKQQPQVIWDVINDHVNEPRWRTDLQSVENLAERNGKPVWRENHKDGNKLTLITTESTPPTRMVRELTDLDGPFSGRWEIDIEPTPSGSNVKVTEVGRITNPVFRFVSKFVIGQTTGIERYLKALAGKLGEQPVFAQ